MNWRKQWEQQEMAEFRAMVKGEVHGRDCACWQCIGRLQAWIVRSWKERLEREGVED